MAGLTINERQFMMMSWLIANTIKDDTTADYQTTKQALIEGLCQAHI